MELKSLDLKGLFFILLLAGLAAIMLRIFSPFMDIVIVALVLVQIFYPFYKKLNGLIKVPGISSVISTIIALVLVVLPIIFIGFLSAFEISTIVEDLNLNQQQQQNQQQFDNVEEIQTESTFETLEERINNTLNDINISLKSSGIDFEQLLKNANLLEESSQETGTNLFHIDLNRAVNQILTPIQENITPVLTGIVSGGISVLFFGFLLIVTMLYMFNEYDKLPALLSKISPLDDDLDELLFKKFTDTNRAVITGSFLVAIAQASAVSLMLLIIGVGAPVLMWMMMVILSLVPVGSGLVWFPIGLVLAATGNPIEGIILIIYSAVIINVIDTTLRPRVMKNAVELHPLIIIFSALGGISAFGPLGILYGPVIAVFFTSLMDVYAERYTNKKRRKKAD